MESKTPSSIESLSHLSHEGSFSPRMGAAMSEDQFSLRSEDSKVKFMCSYGGRIMPRPHDCQLRYVGGETRILVVNRTISLADLIAKLTRLCGKSVLLKYQLPNEDMDSLVSVLCDEDLENMMEEYDRLESRDASTRLRLFLFPAKTHSASVDFHEYDSRNAEQRFVDAVNGFARRQQSLPVSQGLPDYLFGLDHVFGKQDRLQCALPKANSQFLPGARCIDEGIMEKDHQPSFLNSPPILKPPLTSQQEAQHQNQESISLDSLIPSSNKGSISVADHPLKGLEAIEQLLSVIPPAAADVQAAEKQPSLETVLGSSDAQTNWPRSLQRKPELELAAQDLNLDLLSTCDDHHQSSKGSLSLQIEERQLKNSTDVAPNLHKSVEFPIEDDFVEGSNSKAYEQLLPQILHGSQSDEHNYVPADLYSSVQEDNKSLCSKINRDASNLPGQKQNPSREFPRKQNQSSNKLFENSDQKNQKKGEKLSEDRTEPPSFLEKAKQGPYLKAEGQLQEINGKPLDQYLQEGYKFEDSEIPLKPTVAQYSNQQQNLQPRDIPSSNAHTLQWQGEDQIRQHIDLGAVELPRTSAFLLQQTVPSQTNPPNPRVAAAPIPLRAYDPHRQCIAAPQPANLHRQLPALAMPYPESQQQPLPLPRTVAGPTARDQIAPRAPRVQSPSRFRDDSPSRPFQGHWINTDERLLRPVQQSSGGIMLQPIQHDHYVDPSGHMLYDPSISHLHYADDINSSEVTQFSSFQDGVGHSIDQPLDSHSYQGVVLHHARDQPQAGSAEVHRHAIHQVMRT